MNDDRFKELLDKADPPDINLPKHKADLRRSLLTSDKFNRKYFFSIPHARELATGAVASLIISAVVLFNILSDKTVDRQSLLEPIQKNYAGFFAADNINYFSRGLTLFGDNNESLDVDVEKWIDKTNDRYNLVVKDIKTGELLDEIIITDGVLYKMDNPRLQAYNTAGSLRKVVLQMTKEMVKEHHAAGDSTAIIISAQLEDELGLLENSGLIFYHTDSNVTNEVNINDESINTMKVNRSVNLHEYYRDNPVDILNELISSDSLDYRGTFTNEETGVEYYEIVLTSEAAIQDMQKIFVRLQDSTNSTTHTETHAPNQFKYIRLGTGDTVGMSVDSSCVLHEKVKTLRVNADTGEIIEADYSISMGGVTYKLAASYFREQKAGKLPGEDRFDYLKKGLVAAGLSELNYNKIIHNHSE